MSDAIKDLERKAKEENLTIDELLYKYLKENTKEQE